jgi:hypothetical protein
MVVGYLLIWFYINLINRFKNGIFIEDNKFFENSWNSLYSSAKNKIFPRKLKFYTKLIWVKAFCKANFLVRNL